MEMERRHQDLQPSTQRNNPKTDTVEPHAPFELEMDAAQHEEPSLETVLDTELDKQALLDLQKTELGFNDQFQFALDRNVKISEIKDIAKQAIAKIKRFEVPEKLEKDAIARIEQKLETIQKVQVSDKVDKATEKLANMHQELGALIQDNKLDEALSLAKKIRPVLEAKESINSKEFLQIKQDLSDRIGILDKLYKDDAESFSERKTMAMENMLKGNSEDDELNLVENTFESLLQTSGLDSKQVQILKNITIREEAERMYIEQVSDKENEFPVSDINTGILLPTVKNALAELGGNVNRFNIFASNRAERQALQKLVGYLEQNA